MGGVELEPAEEGRAAVAGAGQAPDLITQGAATALVAPGVVTHSK